MTKKVMTNIKTYKISNGNITIELLASGEIHRILSSDIQINQVDGNYIDGSMMNIYLRKSGKYQKILGDSLFAIGDRTASWSGEAFGINYKLILKISTYGVWFWDLNLEGQAEGIDVMVVQDLGLAHIEALKSNEAYMSQYIDQNIVEEENFAIYSRQNQSQNGQNPIFGIGTKERIVGYATDGYDFFGLNYKTDDIIKGLKDDLLPNRVYQYEMTVSALQTEKLSITGEKNIKFFSFYQENYSDQVSNFDATNILKQAAEEVKTLVDHGEFIDLIPSKEIKNLNGEDFTTDEVNNIYSERKLEEIEKDELYSFFTNEDAHVVLNKKEEIVKRSHGHIIMSNKELTVKKDIISTTSYMNGIFQAHTVIGNTTHNKFLSTVRNSLNFFKKSGQRIYLVDNEELYLLSTPSIYEMGFNYSKWLYKFNGDVLEIIVYTHINQPTITLKVNSKNNKNYNFFITHDITMNNIENREDYYISSSQNGYTFTASQNSLNHKKVPDLEYTLRVSHSHEVFDESYISGYHGSNSSLFGVLINDTTDFNITYTGKTGKEVVDSEVLAFEKNKKAFIDHYEDLLNELKIEEKSNVEIIKLNTILRWYTHDMLIHYLVPHGLEQYEGAAWGTRDISQGPTEYFLANQRFDVVREIIEIVYSHQFLETGNWPQWFMFDEYSEIASPESHGDVIVWPLKMLGDYLNYTKDLSILDIEISYVSLKDMQETDEKETLYQHLVKQLEYIKDNFIKDTYLSAYADGDWNDTLQPNDESLREGMVSTWTVELTYQSLSRLSEELENYDKKFSNELKDISQKIKTDFEKYFYNDDVLPGFLLFTENGEYEYIIHPKEKRTNIDYRLLPMTRGIISEIFNQDIAEKHFNIVKDNLLYPDGARLMTKPAEYNGGISKIFKRAEQGANFGREIGLQYVHAHLRYVEAMAKLGQAEMAWAGLQTINPILISDYVENANRRQSNAYFSSSDGDFINRYDAKENYHLLKNGKVNVNGGWRVYSSGPGIYINQLITNVLGIRIKAETIELDPVLPEKLNNLKVSLKISDKKTTFELANKKDKILMNGTKIDKREINNKYREGGVCLEKSSHQQIIRGKNIINY